MGKSVIRVLDTVHCKANKHARKLILPALAYKASKWESNGFGRSRVVVKSHLITGREGSAGTFLTGLLPRVKKYCQKRGHVVRVVGRQERIRPTRPPKLKGIVFRPDQLKALKNVRRHSRGRIVFPTGSGKTLIAAGINSMFENIRVLFLCHTKDLLLQSEEEFARFFGNIFVIGGGRKAKWSSIEKKDSCIVLATIQSFCKLDPNDYGPFFDMVLVDEVHHANAINSQYGTVIQHLLSPLRYGLTATTPKKSQESLTNEGFFGPVIAELSEQEGQEAGIIAKVDCNLISVPYNVKLNQKCQGRYKNFYKYCLVSNRERNVRLVHEVKKSLDQHEQILIIIENIKHGKKLQRMIKRRLKYPCYYVHGSTPKDERKEVLEGMKKGDIRLTIASKVWKEGINIPALDHIINACGGKAENAVLQAVGRGLRTTANKDRVKLTDFLDPYKYLAEHSILRMQVYNNKGWL